MKTAKDALLDALIEAYHTNPDYPWVHGQRLEGIAGNRYGARIDALRKDGWAISAVKAPLSCGWSQYKLDSLTRQQRRQQKVRFDLTMDEVRKLAAGILPDSVVHEAKRLAPNEQVTMF